jgi:hypothetical protein
MKLSILLAASILSSVAMAEPIKVQPIRFLGSDAPSRAYTREVLNGMEAKFAEAGVNVKAKRIKTHIDPFKIATTLENRLQSFRKREGWALRRGYDDPNELKLAFSGRADQQWLYGYANSTNCYQRGCSPFALAAIAETNAAGESRYAQSVIAATHETAHLLGANHIDSYPNVMHGNAMSYAMPINLPWAPNTVLIMQSWQLRGAK